MYGYSGFPSYWNELLRETKIGELREIITGRRKESYETSEGETEHTITMEVPGYTSKDIVVSLTNGELEAEGKITKDEKVVKSFSYSWEIHNVQEDKIGAKVENGILTITLPKTPEVIEKEKTRTIEVK